MRRKYEVTNEQKNFLSWFRKTHTRRCQHTENKAAMPLIIATETPKLEIDSATQFVISQDMQTEDRTEDTSPKIPAVISSGAVGKPGNVEVLSPHVLQEVGINSSQGTVIDSLDVLMPAMSHELNKLDMSVIREELVPEELALTHEGETENSSLVSVVAEFNNGCSAVASNNAGKLDTSPAAEKSFHDLLKRQCQERGIVIYKSKLNAKANKICLVCMQEGGSKAGPFQKVAMYLRSPSEARNVKSWIDKFVKSTAISAGWNKEALNYTGGSSCI